MVIFGENLLIVPFLYSAFRELFTFFKTTFYSQIGVE